jgi:hypothetical protein
MKPITVSSSSTPIKVPVYDRLRDEFAMAALTGLLAAHVSREEINNLVDGLSCSRWYAPAAYAIADAMLKQREAS